MTSEQPEPPAADVLEPLLTTEDVARYLRCDEETVRRMVRDGRLRASKVGRKLLFRPADVQRILDACN
jgi:excisionase family DNA binding protein